MTPGYQPLDPIFTSFIDTDAPPEVVAEGFTWTEGPVWLGGALYFNDIPAKHMHRWSPGDGVSLALENSEFANGNTLDNEGRMISCEHGGRRVVRRLDPMDAGAVEVVASHYESRRLNSPNDVVVHSDGSIWFTDPPYGINSDYEGYAAESEIGGCYVFRAGTDGSLMPVATDFDKPNGLAFSPDEGQLYVADSGAVRGAAFPDVEPSLPHHIRVFDVHDGRLSNGRVFAEIEPGVPDGFRVDHEGYLWTSAFDGIQCWSADARLIGKIRLPAKVANICFGGPSGTDMFITASDKVYRVRSSRRDAAHVLRGWA